MSNFPEVFFGSVDSPLPDWRADEEDDDDPDDEELEQTPADVVGVLGFDPKDESE